MNNEIELTGLQYAMQIHQAIVVNAGIAANALCEMCRNLKIMRDEKLYETLGYEDFDTYSLQMAKIKARQAYTYISAYENLGEAVLQSTANLGITKLSLIAQLPPADRADAIDKPEVIAGMTVAEVKDLVSKAKQQGEQLSLLTDKISEKDEDIQSIIEERDNLTKEIMQKETEVEQLNQKLKTTEKALHDQPIASPDKIVELTKAAKEEAEKDYKSTLEKLKEKHKKDIEKATSEAEIKVRAESYKAAEDKLKADYESRIIRAETIKNEAIGKAEALEKQLMLSDGDIMTVKIYLQGVQDAFKKCITFLQSKQMDPEVYLKCSSAVLKMADMLQVEAAGLIK
ncbi:MAG: hypothetical protein ACYCWE_21035 [Eubacteriales bacterium]